jgi:hypothetical protein
MPIPSCPPHSGLRGSGRLLCGEGSWDTLLQVPPHTYLFPTLGKGPGGTVWCRRPRGTRIPPAPPLTPHTRAVSLRRTGFRPARDARRFKPACCFNQNLTKRCGKLRRELGQWPQRPVGSGPLREENVRPLNSKPRRQIPLHPQLDGWPWTGRLTLWACFLTWKKEIIGKTKRSFVQSTLLSAWHGLRTPEMLVNSRLGKLRLRAVQTCGLLRPQVLVRGAGGFELESRGAQRQERKDRRKETYLPGPETSGWCHRAAIVRARSALRVQGPPLAGGGPGRRLASQQVPARPARPRHAPSGRAAAVEPRAAGIPRAPALRPRPGRVSGARGGRGGRGGGSQGLTQVPEKRPWEIALNYRLGTKWNISKFPRRSLPCPHPLGQPAAVVSVFCIHQEMVCLLYSMFMTNVPLTKPFSESLVPS